MADNQTHLNSSHDNWASSDSCLNLLSKYIELRIVLLAIYTAIIIFGLIGNLLIIYIVIKNKPMRTSTNLFIVNMAVCDLGIVTFMIPKKISEVFAGHMVWLITGNTGQVLCKIVPFLHDMSTECSTYSLLLITFDRFIAVVVPQKRSWLSSRVAVCSLIVSSWVASVCVNTAILKTFSIVQVDSTIYCASIDWNSRDEFLAYVYTMMVTHYLFPIVVIPIVYAAIFRKLKRQFSILGPSISDQQKLQELVRQRKIVHMAFWIVLGFAFCWSPLVIQGVLRFTLFLNHAVVPCAFQRFQEASHNFLVVISVTNPLICFIFGTTFKEELKRIYRRSCKCSGRSVSVGTGDGVTNMAMEDIYQKTISNETRCTTTINISVTSTTN